MPPIKVKVEESLVFRIENYLQNVGIFIDSMDLATETEPKSLICDKKLDEFPVSEARSGGNISWSPSVPNWNPWRASNIDEKPLAFVCFFKDFFIVYKF